MRDLATGMAIAGINFGITEATGFGKVAAKMTQTQRFQGIAEKGIMQAGVSSAITGQDLGKSLQQQLASSMLAISQSVVGDIGVAKGLEDGGLAKTAMHAGVGAVYSGATTGNFMSGALGGTAGELLAGTTDSSELTKLAAASLAFAAGGNAGSIETAGSVAASSVVYNRELHRSEAQALKEEQELAETQEEKQDLEDAAAFLVKVSAGVDPSKNPETYPLLNESEKRGSQKIEAQKKLIARAAKNKLEALEMDLVMVAGSNSFFASNASIRNKSQQKFKLKHG